MEETKLGYSVANARTAEQALEMIKATAEKRCIFCVIDFEKNKPLNKQGEFDPEGKDWPLLRVWGNPFPQEHHAHHIIIIPRRHINNEEFYLLTDEEWLQMLDAWKWACAFYNIPGGGFVGRFGLRSHNAGTIGHLHFQLQVPDCTGNVKATFFKDKSPIEEARRKNREAYNSGIVEGYVIFDDTEMFILNESFHWERTKVAYTNAFVHSKNALPFIAKIFKKEELSPGRMYRARFEGKDLPIYYESPWTIPFES